MEGKERNALIEYLGAARRRRPCGPSASPALNNVECWATKKIIFFWPRGWTRKQKESSKLQHSLDRVANKKYDMIEIKKVREAENEQRIAPSRYKRQPLGNDKTARHWRKAHT